MARDYDTLYAMKKKITMAQKLTKQDGSFKLLTGASTQISETIALIDVATKHKIIPSDPMLQFFREFLIQKNKALFASTCSELSRLSFYLGLKDDSISAT